MIETSKQKRRIFIPMTIGLFMTFRAICAQFSNVSNSTSFQQLLSLFQFCLLLNEYGTLHSSSSWVIFYRGRKTVEVTEFINDYTSNHALKRTTHYKNANNFTVIPCFIHTFIFFCQITVLETQKRSSPRSFCFTLSAPLKQRFVFISQLFQSSV